MNFPIKAKLIFSVSAGLLATAAIAQNSQQPISDEPTFREIFKQSVADASSLVSMRKRDSVAVELSGTVETPTNVVLTNKYFEVPHSDSLSNLPGFQMGFSVGLVSSSRFQLSGIGQTGYAYSQFIGSVKSTKTGFTSADSLRLQRVPLLAGVRATYDSGPVSVFVEPALGMQWLSQNGYLDGVSQNFWVPYASASAGVLLFNQSGSSSWFGGIKIAAGFEKSVGSEQKFEARRYELGIRARL